MVSPWNLEKNLILYQMRRSIVFKAKPPKEKILELLRVYGINLEHPMFLSTAFEKKEQEGLAMFETLEPYYYRSAFDTRRDYFHSYVLVVSILRELLRTMGYTVVCKETKYRSGVRCYNIFKQIAPIKAPQVEREPEFHIIFS